MLAASSSAARSCSGYTDASSLSATVDLAIVEAIFQRGRHATSFPQIYRPYTEVLQENGISPTDDSAYYNFLLKVGVVKAASWGDKWDIWKAASSPSARAPPSPPLRISHTLHPTTPPPPTASFASSKLPEVRRRVPFLASASSDLDEGYTGGTESDPHNHARPSPRRELARKELSTSLVGHTPGLSPTPHVQATDNGDAFAGYINAGFGADADADLLLFDPPIRTSTPVYVQYALRRGAHPDPPAYSASDMSGVLDETTEGLSVLGLSTPRGREATLKHGAQVMREQIREQKQESEREEVSWVDRIEELPLKVRKEMEVRADTFCRLGMLYRCWTTWFRASEWYRNTYKSIIKARENLVLRQSLVKWHESAQLSRSLTERADQHHQHQLKSGVMRTWLARCKDRELGMIEERWKADKRVAGKRKTFARWRARWEARRTERWKKDMAERELGFVARRTKIRVQNTFQYWRIEARSRYHAREKKRSTLVSVFFKWNELAIKLHNLNIALHALEKRKLGEVLDTWRREATLKPVAERVTVQREATLIRRVWTEWRLASWEHKQSTTFDQTRLLRLVLQKWKASQQKQLALNCKAQNHDRTRLLRISMGRWLQANRERLFVRWKEKRLSKRVLKTWQARVTQSNDLEVLATDHYAAALQRRLPSFLSHWRDRLGTSRTRLLQSELVHNQNLLTKSFCIWATSARTVRENDIRAERADSFFLQKAVFKVWRTEMGKRKAEKWVMRKEKEFMRPVFEKWRVLGARYADLHHREIVQHTISDKLAMRHALSRWETRTIEVKDRELKTVMQRRTRDLSVALALWRQRLATVQANDKQASDMSEIRENENIRRIFRSWRTRAKRSKRLRLAAETSIVERESRLVLEVFQKWYEKKRERDLSEIAQEVQYVHEDVLLFMVIDKWKTSTKILPGITADSLRVKRHVWATWQHALERKRKTDKLAQDRDHRLLSEVLNSWRFRAAEKAAVTTRKRVRPSLVLGVGARGGNPSRRVSRQSFEQGEARPSNVHMAHHRTHSASSPVGPSGRLALARGSGAALGANSGIGRTPSDQFPSSDTVVSEPVYSRLRTELGVRRRGASEEVDARLGSGAVADAYEAERRGEGGEREKDIIERPRSGSEMLRALRGALPGR